MARSYRCLCLPWQAMSVGGGHWSRVRRVRLARTALALIVLVAIAVWGLRATGGDHPAGHSAVPRPTVPPAAASTTPVTRSALGDGQPVTIAFGGDVHFEGSLADRLAADPAVALQPVATLLAGADLTMVNLETAVTVDGTCPQPQAKEFVFHTPATAYTALRGATSASSPRPTTTVRTADPRASRRPSLPPRRPSSPLSVSVRTRLPPCVRTGPRSRASGSPSSPPPMCSTATWPRRGPPLLPNRGWRRPTTSPP